ncbi:MAG TPA: isoprenylcysteine carboxylmethyltransferase family protein [Acidobacteriaceae bacterium]
MHWSAFKLLEKGWLLLGVSWLLTALGQKRAVFRETTWRSMIYRGGTVAAFLLMFSGWAALGMLTWRVTAQSAVLEWLGLCVGSVGFAIAFWARILLGGEWSSQVTLKADHRLIVAGPYALVRHPIYTGILLAALGTAMTGGELRMYLGVAVLFAAFWYKSRLEEKVLIGAMGDLYLEYRQHTYALIPGLL